MPDFKKKYGAFKFNTIPGEIIWIAEAPLLLMDIDVCSALGQILIKHRSGLNDEEQELFSENSLIDNWFKKRFLDDFQEVLNDIENNKDSFATLLKQYLEYYEALKASAMVITDDSSKNDNKHRFIKIVAILEWAKKYKITISDKLRAVYQIEQDKTFSATPLQQLPTIKRANDYNECVVETMKDFIEVNGYPPTTVEEIIKRMEYKPPLDFIVKFTDEGVSIEGASPKPIANIRKTIGRLLESAKTQNPT